VLAVERHSIESVKEKLAFDPDHVPKPSDYELEKPFGGRKHFMMAHGLRCRFGIPSPIAKIWD
jgi:hypothetical protein